MFKFCFFRIVLIIGLFLLVNESYAEAWGPDRLRTLLTSLEVKKQIKGAAYSASFHSDDSENLEIINNLLIGLLNRKDRLDKYELKLAPLLAAALATTTQERHFATLELAQKSGLPKLEKAATESLTSAHKPKLAANTSEREQALVQFQGLGVSTRAYVAALFSTAKYTQEEAQNFFYSSRLTMDKRFDLQTFLQTPRLDTAMLSAQLDSTIQRERILAATQIFYLGLDDKALYQKIAAKAQSFITDGDIQNSDEAAWYLKALAASGDKSFAPLMSVFAERGLSELSFHAKYSLMLIDKFSNWKEQVNAANFSALTETQLHILLLQSPYLSMKDAPLHFLIGTRNESKQVADICYLELKSYWPFVRHNAREVRPGARMMQIMGRAGDRRYAELLQEIKDNAPSKHLRAHAAENLSAIK